MKQTCGPTIASYLPTESKGDIGGIVEIVTRKSEGKGASIFLVILFVLAALMGIAGAGSFSDLKVWSFYCLIQAVVNLVDIIQKKKRV